MGGSYFIRKVLAFFLIKHNFQVKVFDLPNAKLETHLYDAIFVCNGRNFCSYTPHFEGIDQFEGNKIHSRYYRRASSFKGEFSF